MLDNIHPLITMHYGENYWFNGCARYVMEAKGEPDYDYDFFAGLTGDNFVQVYPYRQFRGNGRTGYLLTDGNKGAIEEIFHACGYGATCVTGEELKKNSDVYVQTLMAYIDSGVPVKMCIRDRHSPMTIRTETAKTILTDSDWTKAFHR